MAETAATPDAPRRKRRRIGRVLAVLGIALLALAAAALLSLHTPPARRFVTSQVVRVLQQQNIQFDTDELRYNLLDLRLTLRNVRIRSQDAPDLPPFARIDRISLDIGLAALLRGRYVLQSGDAEGIALHYVVDGEGRDNLPRPPHDPAQASEPLDYLIEQLRVRDARVHYENRAQGIDAAMPIASLEVDGNALTDRHAVRLAAAAGTLAVQDRKLSIDSLNGVLDLGDDDVRFERVDLAAEGARAELTGSIAGFSDPQADLILRGTVDAARAAIVAGLREPIAGTAEIDATVKGRVASPAIAARMHASKVGFRTLQDVDVRATAAYDLATERATVSAIELRTPFGSASGHGALGLADGDRSRVTATVSGLDAAVLMQAFDLPYVVASRVDAEVDAEWPDTEFLRASGNARATLTPTTARARRSSIPARGRIEVTGGADAVDVIVRQLTAAGAVADGRVRVTEQSILAGSAQIRVNDVANSVAAAESVLGRAAGSLVPTAIAGSLNATARIGGTISAPSVAAQIAAPALAVGNASDIRLDGALTYTPAQIAVDRLDVQWQQARAHAAGTVGLNDAGRLNLTFDADALRVDELLLAMERTDIPAAGTVSLRGQAGGTTSAPAIDAVLSGTDLTAYNEAWGTLQARVGLRGREAAVEDLLLVKPQPDGDGRLTGRATYHLDRQTYTADLRSQNLQLVSFTLPDGRPVRGTLQIDAGGAGSIDAPAGSATVAADDLVIDTYKIGRIAADAVAAGRRATINAKAPAFGTTAEVVIGLQRPYPAEASIRVDDLQLAALPLEIETPLEGQLRATADLAATLAGEGELVDSLQATARIDSFAGAWNAQPFRIDGPASLRFARNRLAIDQLRIAAGDSTVVVAGELPLSERGAPGAVTVDARANLATLARYAPAGTNVTASGSLTLDGVIRGTLRAVDPELTLVLADGAVATPETQPGLTNLSVRAQVAAGEARIEELAANWGAAEISATGRLPLDVVPALPVDIPRRGGPATFKAQVQGLDLSQLPGAPQGLAGRVSVVADMAAARADLMALEGAVTFPELELSFNGLTLAQQGTSAIALSSGIARVQALTLAGSVGTLAATGTIALAGERAIAVDATGNLNVAAVSLFTDAVRAEGETVLDIAARGTVDAPELNGFVDLKDATFVLDEPTVAAEDVNARLDLSGRRITLAQLTGSLNGGTLAGSGFVELGAEGIADAAVELKANDVAFDAPLDLRSVSDTTLRLARNGDEFTVDGQVMLDQAGLTGDINFDEGLLAALRSRRHLDLTEERNEFLERVRFNVDIDTATPILVDNNLARAEVRADLRLVGSPYEPGLSGRLTVSEESEITLNERRYQVERGVITFIGERRIQPSFDLRLNTSARNYDITLSVTGVPGETETVLTSDPGLPEPDIMALLVTGRTLDEMRGEEFEIAQEQMLSYLAGRVGSQLGRGIERATGFDTVRVEPQVIANEANPSARLTITEDVADDIDLTYSTNLTDSNDQIWVVEYDVTRRFQTRAVRQSDNTYRFDLNHDVRLGGERAPRRLPRQRATVSAVTITGDGRVPDTGLRDLFDVEPGDDYNFFDIRDSVEDIEEALEKQGRLQSRVRLQREGDQQVSLNLLVNAGPQVDLQFEGATPPRKVVDDIRTQWRRGVFDTQRIDDSVDVLRGWLMRDRYLQPTVEGTVEDVSADQRQVRFRIQPGTRFDRVVLAFEGAQGISAAELDDIIEEQDLEEQLFTDPTQVTELLEKFYREQGYLIASIDSPRYEFEGSQARVVLEVDEGPRFVVREVTTAGATVFQPEQLTSELPVRAADPFLPFAAENALEHIRDVYWRRGYNDVRSDYELVLDRAAGQVDVRFLVTEGEQSIVEGITIAGNRKVSDRLIREQLALEEAAPLDLGALARSRRNLYGTQAFSVVDITRKEAPADNGTKAVDVHVAVREVQPFQLRYGLSYDTEGGIGGIADLSNHNSLGKARVLGTRLRYDGQVREVRGYMSQPSLVYWPIRTIGNVYYRAERNTAIDGAANVFDVADGRFDIDRRGVSIDQERELGNSYIWSWGYRYERAHLFDAAPGGVLDETVTVSPLNMTFTRETRDEVLDATRGSFSSQAFGYSPAWLGSDLPYIKYFGQYFHYIPLQRERRERFTNEILRPRFVYAVGVRVGLSKGFGGDVPRSERFFAGGSNTMRGFAQNAVGPTDARGLPLGGDAMLVINNELRMPLVGIFDGVIFGDVGNVFPRVSDFSFSDLRKTAGVGLRARTPWFLIRGDYGLLLDPRVGERRGRFYFSIGQAF